MATLPRRRWGNVFPFDFCFFGEEIFRLQPVFQANPAGSGRCGSRGTSCTIGTGDGTLTAAEDGNFTGGAAASKGVGTQLSQMTYSPSCLTA